MTWYNIWTWPAELIDDIRQWMIVRSALNEPEIIDKFKKFKYQLRVDNIGRVYTVINVPEDLLIYENRDMVWPWVLEEMKVIDDLLMSCRLNDLVYPEVIPVPDAPAYLIILSPSTESFAFTKFLKWTFNSALLFFILFILNRIILKTSGHSVIDLFLSIF
jgi:hypothetical protein